MVDEFSAVKIIDETACSVKIFENFIFYAAKLKCDVGNSTECVSCSANSEVAFKFLEVLGCEKF